MATNTKQSKIKRKLYIILASPFIGRLTRKIAYSLMMLTKWIYHIATKVHHTLPYVRELDTRVFQSTLEVLSNYYYHLGNSTEHFEYKPLISVLIPVYKTDHKFLRETILSVTQQVYDNWEICIVDDCSKDEKITAIILEFQRLFPSKIKFTTNPENLHIAGTSARCLALASGDYIALLDHDDRFVPHALAEVVRFINLNHQPDILYSDERLIDQDGKKIDVPYHKPRWSPLIHLSVNYTTHLSVYRRSLVEKINGFRAGFDGSQDHDLMLRAVEASAKPVVHIPICLYQWRAHQASTAGSLTAKPYAATSGEKAVSEALVRRGYSGEVEFYKNTLHYRLRVSIIEPLPLVSIIIPSKDSYKYIEGCLRSVFAKTTYANYEILISDNGSTSQDVLDLYAKYKKEHPTRFEVVLKFAAFNFAAQVNRAAKIARGQYLLLLNNDTEVLTPDWIQEMLMFAQMKEVGAVGCKLLFKDGTIQHAGIYGHDRLIANHTGYTLKKDDDRYANYLNTVHECLAVTAACLLVSKEKYFSVDGLDEYYLPNGYGDLALCLELRRRGFSSVFTPYAELVHYESPTRGITVEYFEHLVVLSKYSNELLLDPYMNPNLLRDRYFTVYEAYKMSDLTEKQMQFFLNTPRSDWKKCAKELNYARSEKKALATDVT